MLFRQMLQRFWKKDPRVVLDDGFNGSAINTNFWTVTDTEGKISVSGGNLSFSGGLAAPGWGDPALVSKQSWARVPGLTIEWEVTPGATNTFLQAGFTDGTLATDAVEAHGMEFRQGVMNIEANGVIITPFAYTAVSTWCRIVLLSAGALYYVSTDNQATWEAIWKDVAVTTTPVYAFSESYDAALTASRCRVYLGSPKPANVSASPGAPALGLGSELVTNGDMELDASWPDYNAPSTNEQSNVQAHGGTYSRHVVTPGATDQGISQAVAAPAAGTWHKLVGWLYLVSGRIQVYWSGVAWLTITGPTGSWQQVTITVRYSAGNTLYLYSPNTYASEFYLDDWSIKPVPFDTTGSLRYIQDAGNHDGIYDCAPTVSNYVQGGIVCHANSATAPTYCLYAYVDPWTAKAYLLKVENNTTTELIGAAITYSAGAQLRVVSVGTKHALYYNGAIVGTVQTVDVSSNYGTHVHSFQTAAGDSVGVCAVNGGT